MLPIFIAEQKDNPMKLQIEWGRPIQLKDARKDGMIYASILEKSRPALREYTFLGVNGVLNSRLCTWDRLARSEEGLRITSMTYG
jgi:hypothetical protein